MNETMCRVCGTECGDLICADCDNEYAEWLDEMGFVVGEFDAYDHPNFVPDPRKGTKWAVLDN